MAGRPREAHVPRMERKCDIHGLTTFADKGSRNGLAWSCMQCDNAKGKKYYAEVRDGIRVPTQQKVVTVPTGPCCPKHFTVLNALGECGECD